MMDTPMKAKMYAGHFKKEPVEGFEKCWPTELSAGLPPAARELRQCYRLVSV